MPRLMKVNNKTPENKIKEAGAHVAPDFLSTEEVWSFELLEKTEGSSSLETQFFQSAITYGNGKTSYLRDRGEQVGKKRHRG